MSEEFEQAKEHLEHSTHNSKGHNRAALVIAVMAAALALIEFAAKDAQTSYLTNHIAASDTWAQYQAKAVRRTVLTSEVELLQSLPGSNDPAVQKRVSNALANAARMRSEPGSDGMEQLAEKAKEQEHLRDHAMHKNHQLELASGGLQIAIVLASISVVTGLPLFMLVSSVLGVASVIYALIGGLA